MSDTDSVLMVCKHPKGEDGLQGILNAGILDTSNFPPEHAMYSDANTAKLGYWKSVTADEQIIEYVGLRAKAYMIRTKKTEGDAMRLNDKCTL